MVPTRLVASLSAAFLALALAPSARADEEEELVLRPGADTEPRPHGTRFRGAIAAEVGLWNAPSGNYPTLYPTLFAFGIQGQLGVQFNDEFALFALPSCDVLEGNTNPGGTPNYPTGGLACGLGLMVDATELRGFLSVGVGLDSAASLIVNAAGDGFNGARLFGGRARIAIQPIESRRRALSIGLDLRVLDSSTSSGTSYGAPSQLILAPMLSLGYTTF